MVLWWTFAPGAGAQDTLEGIRFSVERFEIVGDNPIGKRADSIVAPFAGEQYGLAGLSASSPPTSARSCSAGRSAVVSAALSTPAATCCS